MKRILQYISLVLLTVMPMAVISCNPLTLDEPLPLAGDFSDPIYPKTYGRVSVEVAVDPNAQPADNNLSTKAGDMQVQFYYIVPGKSKAEPGTHILCAEFARWSDMPAVTLFPEGDYLVVARSQASTTGEYLIGKTDLTVSKTEAATGNVTCELVAGDFSASYFPPTFGNLSFKMTASSQNAMFTDGGVTAPNLNEMPVKIFFVKSDGDTVLAKYYAKSSAIPPIALFPVGRYIVTTVSHATMPDVCDYAYFSDTILTQVEENGAVQAGLDMKMRNTMFSLTQSVGFETAYKSWQADFVFKDSLKPAVTFPSSAAKTFYVAPKPFELRFSAVQNVDNKVVKQTMAYADVKGDSKIVVNLVGSGTGKAQIELYVNGKIVQNDHNVSFPDDDEELGGGGQQPDPGDNPDPEPEPDPVVPPTVVGVGFNVDKVKTLSKSTDFEGVDLKNPLKVIVTAEEGIAQFVIEINSPDIGAELLVPLFGDTKFDLANVPAGSNLETNLSNLGILPKGTPVKGVKTFTFDLTTFMGLLPVNTVTHNFNLKVVDAKGQKIEKIVKILVVD